MVWSLTGINSHTWIELGRDLRSPGVSIPMRILKAQVCVPQNQRNQRLETQEGPEGDNQVWEESLGWEGRVYSSDVT